MNESPEQQTVLSLDIGSGTLDAVYCVLERRDNAWRLPGNVENFPKFILPSPARRVAERLEILAARRQPAYLFGRNMGGGFFRAVQSFIKAGIPLAAHPKAALALSDSPDRVRSMGVELSKTRPPGHRPVHLCDFDPEYWRAFLALAGLEYPDLVLAAAQDHGFFPGESNRLGRFKLWERFLAGEAPKPESLIFAAPPAEYTRLAEILDSMGGGRVADTGAAALLGVLFDPDVETLSKNQGVTIVNIGNSHTVAFLVHAGRVHGIYEHHTGMLDREKLLAHLHRFRQGDLSNQEVFDDRGHGCKTLPAPLEAAGFTPTFVIGPRRTLLKGCAPADEVAFTHPGGDVMVAGCFGLLKGYCSA